MSNVLCTNRTSILTRIIPSMYMYSPLPYIVRVPSRYSILLQRSVTILEIARTAILVLARFPYHELSRVQLGFTPPRTIRDYATYWTFSRFDQGLCHLGPLGIMLPIEQRPFSM